MAVIYAKNKTTNEWERVSPQTVEIDDSLSIQGAPADAKATGEAIDDIKGQVEELADLKDFVIDTVDGLATKEYVDEAISSIEIGGGGTIPADVATKEFVENEIATALAQKTLVQLHKWEEDD